MRQGSRRCQWWACSSSTTLPSRTARSTSTSRWRTPDGRNWPKLVAERSAQRSREEDDAPPAPPPRTRSAPGSWRSSGLLPLHLHRRRSRGEANTSTDYPPSATAPCWHAFGGGRVLAAGAPRVPAAAHPSSPPPPGQHARVIGRVSVIPPDAAPSSMRLQVGTDLRRLSVHQLQLQCTAKTPLAGSPRHPCVTPRSHGPLLPRRHRAPQRPPTASCAMHCTPLVQDLQGHTLRTGRFLFGRSYTQSRDRPHADRVASA